jgi:hypothetical protein
MYDFVYLSMRRLYAIATDLGIITMVQGFGFSMKKSGVLHVFPRRHPNLPT